MAAIGRRKMPITRYSAKKIRDEGELRDLNDRSAVLMLMRGEDGRETNEVVAWLMGRREEGRRNRERETH